MAPSFRVTAWSRWVAQQMVTFRLTVEQFRWLLEVVLAADAPDDLANLVLVACKRPKDGTITVPVPPDDADALLRMVQARAAVSPQLIKLVRVMEQQVRAIPDR